MRLRRRQAQGFKYSRWDGTQVGFDLDADALLDGDDRRPALPRRPERRAAPDDAAGLPATATASELRACARCCEKLRERRREELERRDLGGVYDDIAEQLDEIVDQEREGIDRRRRRGARARGDQRRQELVEELAEQRRQELEQLPPDLAGQGAVAAGVRVHGRRRAPAVRGADGRAARAADAELLQPAVRGHAEHDARAHGADEGHARRAQPDARAARARRGARLRRASWSATATSSPATRRTLDELLEQMAQSMAQMQQLHELDDARAARAAAGARRVAARGHGPALAGRPARAGTCSSAFPNMPWSAQHELQRRRPAAVRRRCPACSTRSATSTTSRTCSHRRPSPASSPRSTSTRRASSSATTPRGRSTGSRELAKMLEEAGLIEQREGRLELTPKGDPRHRAARRSATSSASC